MNPPVLFVDKFVIPRGVVYVLDELLLGVKRGDTINIDGRRQCIADIEIMRCSPAGCKPRYGLLMEPEQKQLMLPLEFN